jgi:hypothetical protein
MEVTVLIVEACHFLEEVDLAAFSVKKNMSMGFGNCRNLKIIRGRKGVTLAKFAAIDCLALEHLPEKLRVNGDLDLRGCERLRRLPKGAEIGGDLNMVGCLDWDRALPEGGTVAGKITTDFLPTPLNEDDYRRYQDGKAVAPLLPSGPAPVANPWGDQGAPMRPGKAGRTDLAWGTIKPSWEQGGGK